MQDRSTSSTFLLATHGLTIQWVKSLIVKHGKPEIFNTDHVSLIENTVAISMWTAAD